MMTSLPSTFDSSDLSHAMRREIYQQPQALEDTIGRYRFSGPMAKEVFQSALEALGRRQRLVIAASGSSRHAGLAGELMIEDLAGVPVDVEYASEYNYRSSYPLHDPGVIVISQSGETADTLAALRHARSTGLHVVAITNNPGSSMAAEASASLPTCAGTESAIPATKSFTTQLAVLYSLALQLAHSRGSMTYSAAQANSDRMQELPAMIQHALPAWEQQIQELAAKLQDSSTLLYLGRGAHYAIAREGALKLKESAYMNAEGYPAGEFKHGPNALVSQSTPLVILATVDSADPHSLLRYSKVLQLIKDLRAQGARIVALATAGDREVMKYTDACVYLPATNDLLSTILEAVPLQLLAFSLAVGRGIDVDRPRNLVKAVVRE